MMTFTEAVMDLHEGPIDWASGVFHNYIGKHIERIWNATDEDLIRMASKMGPLARRTAQKVLAYGPRRVYVSGYRRDDGTWVSSHSRKMTQAEAEDILDAAGFEAQSIAGATRDAWEKQIVDRYHSLEAEYGPAQAALAISLIVATPIPVPGSGVAAAAAYLGTIDALRSITGDQDLARV